MTQEEFNEHAGVLVAIVIVPFFLIMVVGGTIGVFIYGIRWENVVKQLFALVVAILLVSPISSAPIPKHLMKPASVRVGDQFMFHDYKWYYVYQVEGDQVWVWEGDFAGGIQCNYNPFTSREVEALCNRHDLPTDRIWQKTEAMKKVYGGWGR